MGIRLSWVILVLSAGIVFGSHLRGPCGSSVRILESSGKVVFEVVVVYAWSGFISFLDPLVLSAAIVSVSETTTEDLDVCDESVTEVDLPVVVSSSARVSVSEVTTAEFVDVCEECVTEVDLPGVAASSARVSVSGETTTKDVDVCEESEIDVDVPVVVPAAE